MYQTGHEESGEDGDKPVTGHESQNVLEPSPRGLLNTIAHDLHAKKKETKAADDVKNCCSYHIRPTQIFGVLGF